MAIFLKFSGLVLLLGLSTGCVSHQPYGEFSKTVNFSSLDTFYFKNTLTSGMEFREAEKQTLRSLSERTIFEELRVRGFEWAADDPDFFVVAKWRKAVSGHANPFDHIDPYSEVAARRDSGRLLTRVHLTLEIYESSSGHLFWNNELPNIFAAVQLTEERVVESLRRAIQNFPERIEKDPNLPSIE